MMNLFGFLLLLLMGLLSSSELSPINDNNNQHQMQITNILVNQANTSPTSSVVSTEMKWIKTLQNRTENGGQTILLQCQVKSSYPVTFNWYRYNNLLEKNRFSIDQNAFRSSIQLRNLKESQAGFYACEVSNGFQTLTSTGFVRVKNSDIDPIDFHDDIFPSNEYQPEIVSPNDQSIERVKCQPYTGNLCRLYLDSKYISVSNFDQRELEENVIDSLKYLSHQCRQVVLPMICFFVYPMCDLSRRNLRSICRKSCYAFQKNPCTKELADRQRSYSNVQMMNNIITCENLPPTSDDASCVAIDQHRNASTKATPLLPNLISFDSLLTVLLSIFILILLIILLILFFYYCYHHRSNNNENRSFSCSSTLTPLKKSAYLLNPTHSSPFRSPTHPRQTHLNMISSSSSSANTNLTNIHQRHVLPKTTDSKYPPTPPEIPLVNVRYLEEIGEGEFGRIFLGELTDKPNQCLIKTLENENAKQEYLREIEIFRHIRHINISCLIGLSLQSPDALLAVVYEHFNDGDLHEYLTSQRSNTILRDDFLYIAMQIVSGMIYLSEKNFLHNDLSAKNILISDNLDIKITNIARYRQKYQLDYYKIANRSLPVRWMSIEALLSGSYSEMSDVWSFGVLLWEMFSCGIQPYHGQTNPEVIEMIRDRKLLASPLNCSKDIYALMCSCWEVESEERPTFIELRSRLKQVHEKPINEDLISVNQVESPAVKYRSGRFAKQAMLFDKNSIRFEM